MYTFWMHSNLTSLFFISDGNNRKNRLVRSKVHLNDYTSAFSTALNVLNFFVVYARKPIEKKEQTAVQWTKMNRQSWVDENTSFCLWEAQGLATHTFSFDFVSKQQTMHRLRMVRKREKKSACCSTKRQKN